MTFSPVDRLTEQQRVCLRMVYAHMTSKEIAPVLGIEPNSVDQHIKAAMRTLGVADRRSAARMLAKHEAGAASLELREVQSGYEASANAASIRLGRRWRKLSWPKRLFLLLATMICGLLAIGIILAAIDALRRAVGL